MTVRVRPDPRVLIVQATPELGLTPSTEKKLPVTFAPDEQPRVAVAREHRIRQPRRVRRDVLKGGHLLAPIEIVRRRNDVQVPALLRILLGDHDQAVGLRERQRLEHDRVHRREDGDVRADPERKRDDRGDGETGSAPEGAKRKAHVSDEILDPLQASDIVMFFAHALNSSEVGDGNSPSFVRRHSGAAFFSVSSSMWKRISSLSSWSADVAA